MQSKTILTCRFNVNLKLPKIILLHVKLKESRRSEVPQENAYNSLLRSHITLVYLTAPQQAIN